MEEKDYLISIGANITKIRKQRKLSSQALGDLCEIEKSNLIPIEKGKINVTAKTLLKIAQALNVEVKEFFDFK